MPFEKYSNILGGIDSLMPRPNGRPSGIRDGMGMQSRVQPTMINRPQPATASMPPMMASMPPTASAPGLPTISRTGGAAGLPTFDSRQPLSLSPSQSIQPTIQQLQPPTPGPSNPMLNSMKYTDSPINGMLRKYKMEEEY